MNHIFIKKIKEPFVYRRKKKKKTKENDMTAASNLSIKKQEITKIMQMKFMKNKWQTQKKNGNIKRET